jgi:hypothetical protein
MDSGDDTTGPVKNSTEWAQYVYLLIVLVGNLICINLFISMISVKFWKNVDDNKLKFLTKDQE